MTFQVPASKASKGQDKFEFEIGSQKFAIRRLKFLTLGQQEVINAPGRTDSDVLDTVFGDASTKCGKAVRGLDSEQFDALYEAWAEDSEVSPGESSASSD